MGDMSIKHSGVMQNTPGLGVSLEAEAKEIKGFDKEKLNKVFSSDNNEIKTHILFTKNDGKKGDIYISPNDYSNLKQSVKSGENLDVYKDGKKLGSIDTNKF